VVVVGVTTMGFRLGIVFQLYVIAPFAVRIAEDPTQIEGEELETEIFGRDKTITVETAGEDDKQPKTLEPIIEYDELEVGVIIGDPFKYV